METGYTAIFWFVLVSALVVPLILGVGVLFRPSRRYPGKSPIPYECGEDPVGSAWAQFNIRFYIIAVVFIIFDVEVVALFPCAVLFKSAIEQGNAWLIFVKLLIFISILLAGLIYCWVRGDLGWVKGLLGSRPTGRPAAKLQRTNSLLGTSKLGVCSTAEKNGASLK